MKLHSHHMEALQTAADRKFVVWLLAELRKEFPEETDRLSEDRLKRRVAYGMSRAEKYGVESNFGITAFVSIMVSVAPNFDEHQPIRDILKEKDVIADTRMQRVLRRHTDADWLEVRKSCGVGKWPAGM